MGTYEAQVSGILCHKTSVINTNLGVKTSLNRFHGIQLEKVPVNARSPDKIQTKIWKYIRSIIDSGHEIVKGSFPQAGQSIGRVSAIGGCYEEIILSLTVAYSRSTDGSARFL